MTGLILSSALCLLTTIAPQDVRLIMDENGDGRGNPCFLPLDIVLSSQGRVFVLCRDSRAVFRIDRDGTISLALSTGSDTSDPTTLPRALAVDESGALFVADSLRIYRVSPDGKVCLFVDSHPELIGIEAIALDDTGNLYATASSTRTAVRISPAGSVEVILDSQGDGVYPNNRPRGIDVDSRGNVYVAGGRDFFGAVFKISASGDVSLLLSQGEMGFFNGRRVTVGPSDEVYVGDGDLSSVYVISPTGDVSQLFDAKGDGLGHLYLGFGFVGFDSLSTAYISSAHGHVLTHAPDGNLDIVDFAGITLDELANLWAMDADKKGSLVFTNTETNSVYQSDACPAVLSTSIGRNGTGVNPTGFVQLSAPVFGRLWKTRVDSPSDSHLLSILVLSPNATKGILTAWGELLCLPPFLMTSVSAASEREVRIPRRCALLGIPLAAQAALVFDDPVRFEFQNALDITIGSQ